MHCVFIVKSAPAFFGNKEHLVQCHTIQKRTSSNLDQSGKERNEWNTSHLSTSSFNG